MNSIKVVIDPLMKDAEIICNLNTAKALQKKLAEANND